MKKINDKSLELKKRQHYVWAWYMRRWSSNDRDVWYTTKNKKIALDSVRGIAVESNFYKAQRLTEEHQLVLKLIIKLHADKDLQKKHTAYLEDFLYVQHVGDNYRKAGRNNKELDKALDIFITNSLENIHSFHEKEILSILEALADRDLTILDADNNMTFFMFFLSHQLCRTKTFKEKFIANFQSRDTKISHLLNDCWWFIGYMLGVNIGTSFFCSMEDDIHCLLINDTDIPFITSDQPVINVHQDLVYDGSDPGDEVCDLYYPISPAVAYMINKSDRFSRGKISVSPEFVDEMNIKMAKQANVHIIANNKEIIKNYQKYVGYHLGSFGK